MFFAALLAVAVTSPVGARDSRCGDDAHILNQDVQTFDQDPQKGWRSVADRLECRAHAAELLREYREMLQMRLDVLAWHEGQLRAELGQIDDAIRLFERARRPEVVLGQRQEIWNAYVDATIAFLKGDRASLLRARERLAVAPVPVIMQLQPDGSLRASKPDAPPNLDVVDGLIACLGRPYFEAYGSQCRRQAQAGRGESGQSWTAVARE